MHVRGFRGALIAPNGVAIGDFPRLDPVNHALVYMNATTNEASTLREVPDKGAPAVWTLRDGAAEFEGGPA